MILTTIGDRPCHIINALCIQSDIGLNNSVLHKALIHVYRSADVPHQMVVYKEIRDVRVFSCLLLFVLPKSLFVPKKVNDRQLRRRYK